MFTGIIEGSGVISGIRSTGQGKHFTIDADFTLEGTKPGDSVAVNGACLTAVVVSGRRFEADVSPETLSKSTFRDAKIGDRLNLERALRFSDRIDGHLVSGHLDGVGTISSRKTVGDYIVITIEIPESLALYLIEKGSVSVDGVSLTANQCSESRFDVSIIPHTAKLTTISFKKIGDPVNIETDMIGKYVERFTGQKKFSGKGRKQDTSIDLEFLAKTGYL
ncbi:MAG TPA: riboflavin synthase [Deltaproteobacteria bacterium]|nr:riboflavin synthase [Deltaproteobacteria bacterium]